MTMADQTKIESALARESEMPSEPPPIRTSELLRQFAPIFQPIASLWGK